MKAKWNPRSQAYPATLLRLLAAAAAASACLCLLFGARSPGAAANPFDQIVTPIEVGAHMPATKFVDQRGRPFAFSSLLGQAVVVGFIYTRCTDVCPIITQKFAQLDRILGAGSYQLIEVSIDPVHDTRAVVAAYATKYRAFSPRWHILTGEPSELELFARSAGVAVIDNGKGELIHNSRLLLVAPDGKLADVVELVAWDPRVVASELQHLAGAWSSPLARADFALTKAVAQFCGGSYQLASGIIDVVAALLIVGAGIFIMLWMRRRLFAQGA